MEETIIDCSLIHTRDDLHRMFREACRFPDWYGNNLDALYDCLSEMSGRIRLLDWETAEVRLGDYGKRARKVIAAAALRNTALDLWL